MGNFVRASNLNGSQVFRDCKFAGAEYIQPF